MSGDNDPVASGNNDYDEWELAYLARQQERLRLLQERQSYREERYTPKEIQLRALDYAVWGSFVVSFLLLISKLL